MRRPCEEITASTVSSSSGPTLNLDALLSFSHALILGSSSRSNERQTTTTRRLGCLSASATVRSHVSQAWAEWAAVQRMASTWSRTRTPGATPGGRRQAVGGGAREAERPPELEGRVLGPVAVQADRQTGDAPEAELVDDLEDDAALAVAAGAVEEHEAGAVLGGQHRGEVRGLLSAERPAADEQVAVRAIEPVPQFVERGTERRVLGEVAGTRARREGWR